MAASFQHCSMRSRLYNLPLEVQTDYAASSDCFSIVKFWPPFSSSRPGSRPSTLFMSRWPCAFPGPVLCPHQTSATQLCKRHLLRTHPVVKNSTSLRFRCMVLCTSTHQESVVQERRLVPTQHSLGPWRLQHQRLHSTDCAWWLSWAGRVLHFFCTGLAIPLSCPWLGCISYNCSIGMLWINIAGSNLQLKSTWKESVYAVHGGDGASWTSFSYHHFLDNDIATFQRILISLCVVLWQISRIDRVENSRLQALYIALKRLVMPDVSSHMQSNEHLSCDLYWFTRAL